MSCWVKKNTIKFIINIIIGSSFALSNQYTFNILSYNIHGLHPLITLDNSRERIKKIFEKSKVYDIILYQENWIYQDLLDDYFNDFMVIKGKMTKFKNKKKSRKSSGLNIIINNKFEIGEIKEFNYTKCSGYLCKYNDCLASKGFIYTSVFFGKDTLNLYVTHLDAGDSRTDIETRKHQIDELIISINELENNGPLIVCGDFNIDYYSDEITIDYFVKSTNLDVLEWNSKEMIDYILIRDGRKNNINILQYNIPDQLNNLSDHIPIEFQVILSEINN